MVKKLKGVREVDTADITFRPMGSGKCKINQHVGLANIPKVIKLQSATRVRLAIQKQLGDNVKKSDRVAKVTRGASNINKKSTTSKQSYLKSEINHYGDVHCPYCRYLHWSVTPGLIIPCPSCRKSFRAVSRLY